ncbi:MAG TPA: 1-deoxy-D-xylulose-5-phosphate synthase [Candidatus Omnitrophica bacterium]|nr:MAG: hypothetical protein A2Z81_00920 [Omnitrophica WOR_2 bacterium GWA2_45_18]HBR14567.1 1-deoxy-D-xylulose-5-phosphate synthase [Candidatus Omnitrophota bacterium]
MNIRMTSSDKDLRDAFFDELYAIARQDPRVILLTADMGAHSLGRFKKDLSRQYINVCVAEQNMISVAAGLALGGKKVFVYTIIPFATMRCFEQIKVDVCCMRLPVTVVGIGTGLTYGGDGPTHHGIQDIAVMRSLPEMTILNPCDAVITQAAARLAYEQQGPVYVRLERGRFPLIYGAGSADFSRGLHQIREGEDITLIATGNMVHRAVEAADILRKKFLSVRVVDVYRIKPLNTALLIKMMEGTKGVVTLEENCLTGGLGSAVSEVLCDSCKGIALKRLAIPDEHCFASGDREALQQLYQLDVSNIVHSIVRWFPQRAEHVFMEGKEDGFRH